MSIIKAIIKWGIRIAMFFICIYPHNWGLDNYSLVVLCVELGASLIGLCRLEPDQISKVITGFGPDGDYGTYEYTDNGACRIIGWLSWLVAVFFRLLMLHMLYHMIFFGNVGLPQA